MRNSKLRPKKTKNNLALAVEEEISHLGDRKV